MSNLRDAAERVVREAWLLSDEARRAVRLTNPALYDALVVLGTALENGDQDGVGVPEVSSEAGVTAQWVSVHGEGEDAPRVTYKLMSDGTVRWESLKGFDPRTRRQLDLKPMP